jgi:hypothetical protein
MISAELDKRNKPLGCPWHQLQCYSPAKRR